MTKSKISFYFIFIAFFTFMAIFLTIVHASYTNLTSPVKQVEDNQYLEPLTPVLDTEVIMEIEKRQDIDQSQEVFILNNYNNSTTLVSITPTSTQSASKEDQENL